MKESNMERIKVEKNKGRAAPRFEESDLIYTPKGTMLRVTRVWKEVGVVEVTKAEV